MDVKYSPHIAKQVSKGKLLPEIWGDFKDAFRSLAVTMNFGLFDIKKLTTKGKIAYYRLRIRGHRALFHYDSTAIYVEDIAPRSEVYRSWR